MKNDQPLNSALFLQAVEKLKQRGFTAEDDLTLPKCPVCGANALKGYTFKHPTDIAHRCNCVLESEAAYQRGCTKMHRAFLALPVTLETIPPLYRNLEDTTFENFPEKIKNNPLNSLYIYGPPGIGKTYLAVMVMKYLARHYGLPGLFKNFSLLTSELRENYTEPLSERLITVPMLTLDDAGKTRPTQFVHDRFYSILEARMQRHNPETGDICLTFITSNTAPNITAQTIVPALEDKDIKNKVLVDAFKANVAAIASRMGSGYVLELKGGDRRYRSAEGKE